MIHRNLFCAKKRELLLFSVAKKADLTKQNQVYSQIHSIKTSPFWLKNSGRFQNIFSSHPLLLISVYTFSKSEMFSLILRYALNPTF